MTISSVRAIATVAHAVWKRIPQTGKHSDQNTIDVKQDVELNGKILYQKTDEQETNEPQISEQLKKPIPAVSEIEKTHSIVPKPDYSFSNISHAMICVLFMDVPIWTLKYCIFHPNLVLMFLYAILPSHVWFRLFPRLLTLLR